jgi:hypothetical protein
MWRFESPRECQWTNWRIAGGALILLVGVLVSSCGDESLTLDEWLPRWQLVVEHVNDTLANQITHEDCEDILGDLREQRPDLTPPPLGDLREPVDSWFEAAEDLFFVCAFTSDQTKPDTLEVLEAEVELVISLEE